jgi:hypothetical protein
VADVKKTLSLIEQVIRAPQTSKSLAARFGVSDRTLKSRVAAARALGADMQARKMEVNDAGKLIGPYYWVVINADALMPRLAHWLAFEKSGTLVRANDLGSSESLKRLVKGEDL